MDVLQTVNKINRKLDLKEEKKSCDIRFWLLLKNSKHNSQ